MVGKERTYEQNRQKTINLISTIHKNENGYSFVRNQWTSNGRYQTSPDGFLNLDAIATSDALEQNLQGQNVIGVIDNGWGEDTRPCVNLTDDEWHIILSQFVSGNRTVYISNGTGGRIQLTSAMVNETLEDGSYRYKMYPYVVKLILNQNATYGQNGWHVDCAIVDTKTYSVSYEYNLPSSAIIQEGDSALLKPETKFYTPGTTGVEVGVMTLDRNNVTGDTSVTVYDTNTQTTSEYKFLYWNTAPDGSGTSYSPDDTLPAITENVVLYAIWNHTQTSGTLKLQKTYEKLTVHKIWDDNGYPGRPDSVTVTLYRGDKAVDKVTLGEWNDWSHTWEALDGNGDWCILETGIPKGYTPSYAAHGNVVIITNTASLIETGQLSWSIPVFGGLGALMIFVGILLVRRKSKEENA